MTQTTLRENVSPITKLSEKDYKEHLKRDHGMTDEDANRVWSFIESKNNEREKRK